MRVVFFGRIHPERANLSVGGVPKFQVRVPSCGEPLSVQTNIIRSQLTAVCEGAGIAPEHIPEIRNYLQDLLVAQIDFLGFAEGAAYNVEITGCINPGTNETQVFGWHHPDLAGLAGSVGVVPGEPERFTRAFILACTDDNLRNALGDARRALSNPTHTALYCYKAIEHLRTKFQSNNKPTEDEKKSAWVNLRDAMRIDRTFIEPIAARAQAPRHGSLPFISWTERQQLLASTWMIIDRYIEWAKAGGGPLNASKFPILAS